MIIKILNFLFIFISIKLIIFSQDDTLKDKIYFSIKDLHSYTTIMLIINPETGEILNRSLGAKEFYGYSELIGMNIKQINTLKPEQIDKEMQKAKNEKRNFFHFKHRLANGDIREVHVNSYPMKFNNKTVLVSRIRDVTEEIKREKILKNMILFVIFLLGVIIVVITILLIIIREAKQKIESEAKKVVTLLEKTQKDEEIIKKQLQDKELILKEVHHRIKNNIISIESLLTMQLDQAKSQETLKILKNAISQIECMRVLYEKLLVSNEYMESSVKSYVESLIDAIISVVPNRDHIIIEKNISDFNLESKKLFYIGVIINELITNSIKHAYREHVPGKIEIILYKNGAKAILIIKDEGKGFNYKEVQNNKSFGLTIINMLCDQLNANFYYLYENGTKAVVDFLI